MKWYWGHSLLAIVPTCHPLWSFLKSDSQKGGCFYFIFIFWICRDEWKRMPFFFFFNKNRSLDERCKAFFILSTRRPFFPLISNIIDTILSWRCVFAFDVKLSIQVEDNLLADDLPALSIILTRDLILSFLFFFLSCYILNIETFIEKRKTVSVAFLTTTQSLSSVVGLKCTNMSLDTQ